MTPEEFKAARRTLGLSASKMAAALKVSHGRTIRRWEAGHRDIPGPAIVAVQFMLEQADYLGRDRRRKARAKARNAAD